MKKNILLILLVSLSGRTLAMDGAQMREHQRLEKEGLFLVLADTQQTQRRMDIKVEELAIKHDALVSDYTERMAAEELEIENLRVQLAALSEQKNKSAAALSIVPVGDINAGRFAKLELVDEQNTAELLQLRAKLASLQDDQKNNVIAQNSVEVKVDQISSMQFWTTVLVAGGAVAIGALVYAVKGQQSEIAALQSRPIINIDGKGQPQMLVVDEAARAKVGIVEKRLEDRTGAVQKRLEDLQKSIDALNAKPTLVYTDKATESQSKTLGMLQKELDDLKARPTINFAVTKSEDEQALVALTITDNEGHTLVLTKTGYPPRRNKHHQIVYPGSYSDYQNNRTLTLPLG